MLPLPHQRALAAALRLHAAPEDLNGPALLAGIELIDASRQVRGCSRMVLAIPAGGGEERGGVPLLRMHGTW